MNKRGQVTLFVILGIFLLFIGIIIYSIQTNIFSSKTSVEESPKTFIKNCVEGDFINLIENVSMNGGSNNPRYYFSYYGYNIQILCYSSKSFEFCTIQKPLLIESVTKELEKGIEEKLNSCFDELVLTLENKGYVANLKKGDFAIELSPKRIILNISNSLEISKKDTRNFENFDLSFENNLYELLSIARGIVEWESLLGDADVVDFMSIYQDFEITKNRLSEEMKIYTIKYKGTGDTFQFASRSLAFPAGLA